MVHRLHSTSGEVCGSTRPTGKEILTAHNAITDRVRLTGPQRDYRALDMGRYRVPQLRVQLVGAAQFVVSESRTLAARNA
jgi:hypothetical protein